MLQTTELRRGDIRPRVKGRPVLERRLAGLLVAVHRFATRRAKTRDEVIWAGALYDHLQAALEAARHQEGVSNGR